MIRATTTVSMEIKPDQGDVLLEPLQEKRHTVCCIKLGPFRTEFSLILLLVFPEGDVTEVICIFRETHLKHSLNPIYHHLLPVFSTILLESVNTNTILNAPPPGTDNYALQATS